MGIMPSVKIPKEYAKRKHLIAVPEDEYRRFRDAYMTPEEEVAVRESEADVKAGRVVAAKSAREALAKMRALGWLDDED